MRAERAERDSPLSPRPTDLEQTKHSRFDKKTPASKGGVQNKAKQTFQMIHIRPLNGDRELKYGRKYGREYGLGIGVGI